MGKSSAYIDTYWGVVPARSPEMRSGAKVVGSLVRMCRERKVEEICLENDIGYN